MTRKARRTAIDVMMQVFAAHFAAASWKAWRTFVRALFALPMDDADMARFTACTGRQTPLSQAAREAWMVVGRRGGKTLCASFLVVYLACFCTYRLAAGERGVVMLMAADRRQARVAMRYVRALLESSPMTRALVTATRADSIDLANHITIEIHTASFRSVRGYTCVAAVLDELAFFDSDESAANPDSEIVAALRPAMATIPNALLLGISSPHARKGELWKNYSRHFGKDESPVLVWQADTRTMNENVPQALIDAAYADDDATASAEYGAQFRRDIEAFLSREAIDAVLVPERRELPFELGVSYTAFVDPSGGSQDSMTLAIAHKTEKHVGVLDAVREWKAPFSPEAVVAESADILHRFGVRTVTGDRYAGEWPRERFRRFGIDYRPSERTKSEIYQAFAPLVNAARCELLDAPVLVKQLAGLERKTARSGKDSVDHGPRGRDDVANAVAGALVLAAGLGRGVPVAYARLEHLL